MFAANYTTRSGADPEEGESSDALPPPEPESTGRCARIQLKNGLGYMYKRIIRFHRFNQEKEASKLYRFKLMLYLPWRDESTGGYSATMKTSLMISWQTSRSTVSKLHSLVRLWTTSTNVDALSTHGIGWPLVLLNRMLGTELKEPRKSGPLSRRTWMPMHASSNRPVSHFSSGSLPRPTGSSSVQKTTTLQSGASIASRDN